MQKDNSLHNKRLSKNLSPGRNARKKSRIWETLNLSTDADSSSSTVIFFFIFFSFYLQVLFFLEWWFNFLSEGKMKKKKNEEKKIIGVKINCIGRGQHTCNIHSTK